MASPPYSGSSAVFRNTALKTTVAAGYAVKSSSNGRVWSIHAANGDAAVCWINVYDAALFSDVTPGTTTPAASFRVPASASQSFSFSNGIGFVLGCVVTCSTADGGGSAGSNGASVTIEYQ